MSRRSLRPLFVRQVAAAVPFGTQSPSIGRTHGAKTGLASRNLADETGHQSNEYQSPQRTRSLHFLLHW